MRNRRPESVAKREMGLPTQQASGTADVRTPLTRVVLRQRLVDNPGSRPSGLEDFTGKFQHGQLMGIPNVGG